MNKSQIIGGVVCLVLAVFFQILAVVLSPEKVWLTFMVGSLNVSIVSVILAIAGFAMLLKPNKKKKVS